MGGSAHDIQLQPEGPAASPASENSLTELSRKRIVAGPDFDADASTVSGAPQHGKPGERHDSANDLSGEARALASRSLASAAIAASESHERSADLEGCPTERVDSAQDAAPRVPETMYAQAQPRPAPPPLQTHPAQVEMQPPPTNSDSIANSPTLRRHTIPPSESSANTLPAVQPSLPQDPSVTSPQSERLPSFRQLSELADVAASHQTHHERPYSHHHSRSFGSTTSQSPRLLYHGPFAAQSSPVSHYAMGVRSPTVPGGEMPPASYGSPTQHQPAAYYADRRISGVVEAVVPLAPHAPISSSAHTPSDIQGQGPPLPASLPSASTSSGESHGHTSSSTDGYSTNHTTPIDQASVDGAQRHLPPPPQHGIVGNVFPCDWPGCNAPPFQTQYLLSSHRNVHSQNRPHYCPVPDCPRSEGGKGFKRKNEMIRHGLVHNSPGYICPFCPDREHKYPRPDNLQRHVRVHHVDKDRDDPQLREVLAQRIEGGGKQRRRRTNTEDRPLGLQS